MASKFGGIPVEEPKRSKFGGIPVEESTQSAFGGIPVKGAPAAPAPAAPGLPLSEAIDRQPVGMGPMRRDAFAAPADKPPAEPGIPPSETGEITETKPEAGPFWLRKRVAAAQEVGMSAKEGAAKPLAAAQEVGLSAMKVAQEVGLSAMEGAAKVLDPESMSQEEWNQLSPAAKQQREAAKLLYATEQAKNEPLVSAAAGSTPGKIATALTSQLMDAFRGQDREPTIFEVGQKVQQLGLAQKGTFKERFFGETLPRLAMDTPFYIASGALTKGFGMFTLMNVLDQGLDKVNLDEEFDPIDLKTAILTDWLFKALPGFVPTAAGPGPAVAAEVGNIILRDAGILTGTGTLNQWAHGEDIDPKSVSLAYIENVVLLSMIHSPGLYKAAKTPKPRPSSYTADQQAAMKAFWKQNRREVKSKIKAAKAGDKEAQAWLHNEILRGIEIANKINPQPKPGEAPAAQGLGSGITTPEGRPVTVTTAPAPITTPEGRPVRVTTPGLEASAFNRPPYPGLVTGKTTPGPAPAAPKAERTEADQIKDDAKARRNPDTGKFYGDEKDAWILEDMIDDVIGARSESDMTRRLRDLHEAFPNAIAIANRIVNAWKAEAAPKPVEGEQADEAKEKASREPVPDQAAPAAAEPTQGKFPWELTFEEYTQREADRIISEEDSKNLAAQLEGAWAKVIQDAKDSGIGLDPVWGPMELVFDEKHWPDFMFMGTFPQNDKHPTLYQYKHADTRRGIMLDDEGRAYQADWQRPDGPRVPDDMNDFNVEVIDLEKAMARVTDGWAKMREEMQRIRDEHQNIREVFGKDMLDLSYEEAIRAALLNNKPVENRIIEQFRGKEWADKALAERAEKPAPEAAPVTRPDVELSEMTPAAEKAGPREASTDTVVFQGGWGAELASDPFDAKWPGLDGQLVDLRFDRYHFTDQGEVAETYGPDVKKVRLKYTNAKVLDAKGKSWDDFMPHGATADAYVAGHDAVIFKNLRDEASGSGAPSTVTIVFNKDQIVMTGDQAEKAPETPQAPAAEAAPEAAYAAKKQQYYDDTVKPAIDNLQSAITDFGMERMLSVGLKPGESIRQWIEKLISQKAKWDHGTKIGETAIQMLSRRNLWPADDGTGEGLRKAVLAVVRVRLKAPMWNDTWLDILGGPPAAEPAAPSARIETLTGGTDVEYAEDALGSVRDIADLGEMTLIEAHRDRGTGLRVEMWTAGNSAVVRMLDIDAKKIEGMIIGDTAAAAKKLKDIIAKMPNPEKEGDEAPAPEAAPGSDVEIVPDDAPAGKLSPLEMKRYLLAGVEKAIKAAPEGYAEENGRAVFNIPGDGSFYIYNDKGTLREFKRRAGRFPTGQAGPDVKRPPKPVPARIPAVAKSRPTAKADLIKAVSVAAANKKDQREMLKSPYVNEKAGELVATDGRRLAVVLDVTMKLPPKPDSAPYPDYAQAVPGYTAGTFPAKTYSESATIDTGDLLAKINQALQIKDEEQYVYIYRTPAGTLEVVTKPNEIGSYESADVSGARPVAAVSSAYLKDGLTFLRRMGNEAAELQYALPPQGETFAAEPLLLIGSREYYLQMPWRVDEEDLAAAGRADPYQGEEPAAPAGGAGVMGEQARPSKGGDASGGLGDSKTPVDDPEYSMLPIELPELVEFMELLGEGKLPRIRPHLGRAFGLFRFREGDTQSGSIELLAEIYELISPEEKYELRKQALEYARKMKEMDPGIDAHAVWLARFEYLYEKALEERKKQDPILARKTIAHEIGHWVGFITKGTLKHGNILGHIGDIFNYTKHLLEEKPGSGNVITQEERDALKRQARVDLKALHGEVKEIVEEITREVPIYETIPITVEDITQLVGLNARESTPELYEWFARQDRKIKKEILKAALQGIVDARAKQFERKTQVGTKKITETVKRTVGGKKITDAEIKAKYEELLRKEIKKRRLHELDVIKEELQSAIAWWNGTETMPPYYKDPAEMFADAFSIFINNPMAAAKRAPNFFRALMQHMESRPLVKQLYDQLQEDIRSGAIYRNRVKRLRASFTESGETMMERYESGRKKSKRERVDLINYGFNAVFGPIESRIGRAPISADRKGEIGLKIENYLYRATGHEYLMARLNQEVVRPLLDAGLMWIDLAEYMFHRRVYYERHSKANPKGFSPKESMERLQEMEHVTFGPAKWQALQDAQQAFWGIFEVVRDLIRESGYVTPRMMRKIEDNIYYVTFSVLRPGAKAKPGSIMEMLQSGYGSNIGPRIWRQLGTHQNIMDPAAATVAKMISLLDAARKNIVKVELVDLMLNYYKNEIDPAERKWNGRDMEIQMKDTTRAGTIIVMRQGKPFGYYVPKVFVEMFERDNPLEIKLWLKMMGIPTRALKSTLVQLNYGIWPMMFGRDVGAYYLKMPRVSGRPFGGPQFWRFFIPALIDSWSSVIGKPNAGALDSLKKNDWITVANPLATRSEGEVIDKQMRKYWQDTTNTELDAADKALRALQRWMETGQVFERTVKRVARLYLESAHGDMPEYQKLYYVHNAGGSPNFLRLGALNPYIDFVGLFFNPTKEAARSTFKRIGESPATMIWNYTKLAMVPKLIMWLFATGVITAILKEILGEAGEQWGKDKEDMYRYIPEYDKANYTVIPLGWADRKTNKVLYLKIPLPEELRPIAAVTWKVLNHSGDYNHMINYMGGQLPVGNPIYEVPVAWAMYATGNNPYDWFRGEPLLDERTAEARSTEGLKQMGKYSWNALGGGMIHRFDMYDYNDEKTRMEKFLKLPIISNAVGRWFKISNRGYADTLRNQVALPLRKEQARAQEKAYRALVDRDFEKIGELMKDPRAAKYLRNNAAKIYQREGVTPEQAMLMFAPTVEERAKLLERIMSDSMKYAPRTPEGVPIRLGEGFRKPAKPEVPE